MTSGGLLAYFCRTIFCNARSSWGSSSPARERWIILVSACSSTMRVVAATRARARKSINSYVVPSRIKVLNSYASTGRTLYPRTSSSDIYVVFPCSILRMRDKVPTCIMVVESGGVGLASFDCCSSVFAGVSRFRHLFFFGGSYDPGASGVAPSVWFVRCCHTPKSCCFVERGLYCGEATNVIGVFCCMVTSSVVGSSASSHSTRVTGNARCFCVFGGGGAEMGVGFRAAEGGEWGLRYSQQQMGKYLDGFYC